jgi:hypothetical protein
MDDPKATKADEHEATSDDPLWPIPDARRIKVSVVEDVPRVWSQDFEDYEDEYAFEFHSPNDLKVAVSVFYNDPELKRIPLKGNGEPNTVVVPDLATPLIQEKLGKTSLRYSITRVPTLDDLPEGTARKRGLGLFY